MEYKKLQEAMNKYMQHNMFDKAIQCLQYMYEGKEVNRDVRYSDVVKFRKKLKRHLCEDSITVEETRIGNLQMRESYRISARDIFRDFVLFIEYNRKQEEQFLLPRVVKLAPIIEALQELEDDRLDELFISQPARTGKSTLVMLFSVWVMLKHPEKSNLYVSYTDTVAGVFYNGLLEVLNDTTTYAWVEVFPERKVVSTNAKDLLINIDRKKHYPTYTARSLYGTLNGACDCNGYEIADDLISGIEEAMNKDRLAGLMGTNALIDRSGKLTFRWYTNSGSTATIGRDVQYQSGFKRTTEEDFTLQALTSGYEDNILTAGSGRGIEFSNPFMTQTILLSQTILPYFAF